MKKYMKSDDFASLEKKADSAEASSAIPDASLPPSPIPEPVPEPVAEPIPSAEPRPEASSDPEMIDPPPASPTP